MSTALPVRSADWLVEQLPVSVVDDGFFTRLVRLFQAMGETVLVEVDELEHLLDLDVTPLPFLRHLATWLDVQYVDPHIDDEKQRQLVKQAGQVLLWRGTEHGLRLLLSILCDSQVGIEVEDTGWVAGARSHDDPGGHLTTADPRADRGHGNRVVIRVPDTGWMTVDHFLAVLEDEVPAEVCFDLWVGGTKVFPESEES